MVTSDLENIVNGRDFLQLLVFAPLQCAISIWGLYLLLGWRCVFRLMAKVENDWFIEVGLVRSWGWVLCSCVSRYRG